MNESKIAVIANAISAGVNYRIEYSGDGYFEPELITVEFDYLGFWNYLKDWYGEDVANVVFEACGEVEDMIVEMANNEII